MTKSDSYKRQLRDLQIEIVKLNRHVIESGERLLVIFEGRDAAGKDGTIKRIVEHSSPRETRVVALGKPSDRDVTSWYFQRWVAHLPAGGELVYFNRSWYNRAGVERVMGFCSDAEYERFLETVPEFEHMLVQSGILLRKFYLDISRDEQAERLEDRRESPLKRWKISPIDARALELFDDYSAARDVMLERTHSVAAPWFVVAADHKKTARLEVMRCLLRGLDYADKDPALAEPDPSVVFEFEVAALRDGRLER